MDYMKNTSNEQNCSADYWKIVPANLKRLIVQNKTSQKKLAQEMHITESAMSGYCKGKSMPGVEFFVKLKELYGISIDEFLTKYATPGTVSQSDLVQDNALTDTYRKYCGSYYVYYLNAGRYKGNDDSAPGSSIIYGVLYIYENPSALGIPEFSCAAILGIKDKDDAVFIKDTLDRFTEPTDSINYIEKEHGDTAYFGSFDITHDHAFINMSDGIADKALLILHHPKILRKEYIGGLCTINSVSKGRRKDPVVQFMGLSRYPLPMSAEEIHHCLLLDHPSLTTEADTVELIETMKSLYCEEGDNHSSLSERQKSIIVRSHLEMFIKKSLETNIFRYGKISGDDDDDWYHIIKSSIVEE